MKIKTKFRNKLKIISNYKNTTNVKAKMKTIIRINDKTKIYQNYLLLIYIKKNDNRKIK